jgi:hypothetical protein
MNSYGPFEEPGVISLNTKRLKKIIADRNGVEEHLVEVRNEASRLSGEANMLVWEANTASDLNTQLRTKKQFEKVFKQVKRQHAKEAEVVAQLSRKDKEIATIVDEVWKAVQVFIAAHAHSTDGRATSVDRRLEHLDTELSQVKAALRSSERLADKTAADLLGLRREVSRLAASLGKVGPGRDRITQVGWDPDAATGTDAPVLSEEETASLPETSTVLLFAAEPRNQPRPDLDKEIQAISTGIDRARLGHRITLKPWTATQPFDLLPTLNAHKPHMVQFSGHGVEGGLLLMGQTDKSEFIGADQLVQMLRWTNQNLRVVFFNICHSETHARLAAEVVDVAIGMCGKIADVAAREFATQLYSALAFGLSVERAFQQACAAIANLPDRAVPRLLFRGGSDPSRIMLVRP